MGSIVARMVLIARVFAGSFRPSGRGFSLGESSTVYHCFLRLLLFCLHRPMVLCGRDLVGFSRLVSNAHRDWGVETQRRWIRLRNEGLASLSGA